MGPWTLCLHSEHMRSQQKSPLRHALAHSEYAQRALELASHNFGKKHLRGGPPQNDSADVHSRATRDDKTIMSIA